MSTPSNIPLKKETVREVEIKPEFLYNLKSNRKTLKKKSNPSPNIKPCKLKQTLLEKIKRHRLNAVSKSASKIDKDLEPNLTNNTTQIGGIISKNTHSPSSLPNDLEDEFKASCNFLEGLSKKKKKDTKIGGSLIINSQEPNPLLNKDKLVEPQLELPNQTPFPPDSSPPYSCLKNGSKPTFRQWKQTLKNSENPNSSSNNIKYSLGKSGRKVSILVKNNETRKKISKELILLKQVKLTEMKNYLKKHNLLKSGSYAPSDVIKKIYEQSVLSGEINNSNKDGVIHNYLGT